MYRAHAVRVKAARPVFQAGDPLGRGPGSPGQGCPPEYRPSVACPQGGQKRLTPSSPTATVPALRSKRLTGRGTSMRAVTPFAPSSAPSSAPAWGAPTRPASILVVDDEAPMREVLLRNLR